jgi:hypothetical protein
LQLLGHLTCSSVQPLPVWIEQQHVAREVAKSDDARAGLGYRVVRILCHGHRVLVGEGDRTEVERLLEESEQPVLIFVGQLIEGRLVASPHSLTAAILYAVAATSAGLARQRAILSARA